LTQTRVGRFLSSPKRVDVGMIGGQAGRHLGTLGNGAVAGDQDIDVPGGLSQPVARTFCHELAEGATDAPRPRCSTVNGAAIKYLLSVSSSETKSFLSFVKMF